MRKSRAKYTIPPVFEILFNANRLDKRFTLGVWQAIYSTLCPDDTNVDRIRECEACSAIYWASRSDSKTCSAKCLNIYSLRRFRSKTD